MKLFVVMVVISVAGKSSNFSGKLFADDNRDAVRKLIQFCKIPATSIIESSAVEIESSDETLSA